MLEAYRFFGFGPNMIKMLTVLGSGRTACLLLEEGALSRPIPLERRRTQGNGPSPCEYNIGQQILLFKLEFCSELQGVYNHLRVPRHALESTYLHDTLPFAAAAAAEEDDKFFVHEAAGQSSTAEGFADDTTAAVLFSYENLFNLFQTSLSSVDFNVTWIKRW